MKSKLDKIISNELCIGCGICESVGKENGYKMNLRTNGFYYPQYPEKRDKKVETFISRICPAVNINGVPSKDIWGRVLSANIAWSNDEEIRYKGSSGGAITAFCVYLLENKYVDAVLQVGKDENHFMHNKLKIARTRTQVINNASSRYAPASVLNEIETILSKSEEKYCFVGKPCDILGLKNYISSKPQYKDRIVFSIALFCAGIPSYNATMDLLKETGRTENPVSLKYRGGGWPGNFEAKYADKSVYKTSYTHSWGKVLGRQVHFRCKICPDAIGLLADISVGDAWESIDGYPDFTEKPGRSFILIRTALGKSIFQKMKDNEAVSEEMLDMNQLALIQKYHYQRRLYAGWRLLPIHVISGFLFTFKHMNFPFLMRKIPFLNGIRAILGVIKRSFNRNNYYNRNNY